jgi:hypothetical protein
MRQYKTALRIAGDLKRSGKGSSADCIYSAMHGSIFAALET